jgi:hypothetical protein
MSATVPTRPHAARRWYMRGGPTVGPFAGRRCSRGPSGYLHQGNRRWLRWRPDGATEKLTPACTDSSARCASTAARALPVTGQVSRVAGDPRGSPVRACGDRPGLVPHDRDGRDDHSGADDRRRHSGRCVRGDREVACDVPEHDGHRTAPTHASDERPAAAPTDPPKRTRHHHGIGAPTPPDNGTSRRSLRVRTAGHGNDSRSTSRSITVVRRCAPASNR